MKKICVMRDLYKALMEFEESFLRTYGVSLNEAMILCSLQESDTQMTSSALAQKTQMSPSNTSKVIGSAEEKCLIKRMIDKEDKRQMLFELSPKGESVVNQILNENIQIPDLLKPLFN